MNVASDCRANRLLAGLPSAATRLLESKMECERLERGRVLYETGAAIDKVYFPHSGLSSVFIPVADGIAVEVATVGREGAIGIHSGLGERKSNSRVVSHVPGVCSSITAPAFKRIVDNNPPLLRMIFRYTEMLWIEAQQNCACNAVHDSAARLSRWLLQCADKIGSDHLPLTQELLSKMLGVRRTTVTAVARMLKENGIIQYRRGYVVLVERRELEIRACECYRTSLATLQQRTKPGASMTHSPILEVS